MTADTAAVALVLAAAPAATAVPLLYTWKAWRSFYRSVHGLAIMTTSWGLALLIDISLLYNWLGDDYALRDVVRLSVYSIILASSWLTCIAMALSYFRHR